MSTTARRFCLPFGKCPATSTKDRILDAALASFASRGYEATSLDAVGKGLESDQAVDPLLVPVQGRTPGSGDRPECGRSLDRPRDGAARSRGGLGAGGSRRPFGVPPGGAPTRAPRIPARSGPIGSAGGDPDDACARSPHAAAPRRSWKRRWTPARCAGTTRGCCCWPSTPR